MSQAPKMASIASFRSTMTPSTPTIGVVAAADILHVHPNRVLELISAGAFPAGKVGRSWVMMTKDVLAYAEKLIIAQTAERLASKGTRSVTRVPRRGPSL